MNRTSKLIESIQAIRAFGVRGDGLGTPLSPGARSAAQAAEKALTQHLVSRHLGPRGIEFPELRSLRDFVWMIEQLIVEGDDRSLGASTVTDLWALRAEVVRRMAEHPGGDLIAEMVDKMPGALAAGAVAGKAASVARMDATFPGLAPMISHASEAAPAAEAEPKQEPAPAALPQSFSFGASPAPEAEPSPEATPPGPVEPVTSAEPAPATLAPPEEQKRPTFKTRLANGILAIGAAQGDFKGFPS